MSLHDWAEHEVKLACKYENPNWDGESFDYGCACYQSALKAFKSLMEDGHSGSSFGFTKNILIRLLNTLPLKPITDEDFEDAKAYFEKDGAVAKQCPRMPSLFRHEDVNGNVSYSDTDRQYCIEICDENDTYHNGHITEIIDKMFPITMPYYPSVNKYKVYIDSFLVNPANGDFDTKGVIYCITPEGERVEINLFFTVKDCEWVEITREEYEELKKNKL